MNGEFERIRDRLVREWPNSYSPRLVYNAMLDLLAELARRDREEREAAQRSVGG